MMRLRCDEPGEGGQMNEDKLWRSHERWRSTFFRQFGLKKYKNLVFHQIYCSGEIGCGDGDSQPCCSVGKGMRYHEERCYMGEGRQKTNGSIQIATSKFV